MSCENPYMCTLQKEVLPQGQRKFGSRKLVDAYSPISSNFMLLHHLATNYSIDRAVAQTSLQLLYRMPDLADASLVILPRAHTPTHSKTRSFS